MNRYERASKRTVNELGVFLDVDAPSPNVSVHPHGYEKEVLICIQVGSMVIVDFWVIENNMTPMSGEAVIAHVTRFKGEGLVDVRRTQSSE
jgi:hypothetical protein